MYVQQNLSIRFTCLSILTLLKEMYTQTSATIGRYHEKDIAKQNGNPAM